MTAALTAIDFHSLCATGFKVGGGECDVAGGLGGVVVGPGGVGGGECDVAGGLGGVVVGPGGVGGAGLGFGAGLGLGFGLGFALAITHSPS